MPEIIVEPVTGRAWLAGAVLAAIVGGVVTIAFAAWWFGDVGGHCGVVRFYEQLFGLFVVGGWFFGSAAGLLLAFIGRRRSVMAVVVGSLLAILVNGAAVAVCAKVVYETRAADYTLKSTDELLGHLNGTNFDAKAYSAHALGERRAGEALVPLCAILGTEGEDVNLRYNAATAIGRICAPPCRNGIDVDRALAALTGALKSREEFLPHAVFQAMGEIGDVRVVDTLAEFLRDASRPMHAREEAARALGRIGGGEARSVLEKTLPGVVDESLTRTIRSAMEAARRPPHAGARP